MIDKRDFMIGAGALAAASLANAGKAARAPQRFPRDFLWGAATAGHQIEGNNTASDMWLIEHQKPTFFAEPSGDACNSFELWPADLDIVKRLGLNSYRFSLEWSRIEPVEGAFSIAMLDHYKAVIAGCRARGLTPIVTFSHYSAPLWFSVKGSWTNPQAPALFARFCERAARHLAADIGYAITLNEPNGIAWIADMAPPALQNAMFRKAYDEAARRTGAEKFRLAQIMLSEDVEGATTNLIAGHKAARTAIKAVRPDLPVGAALAIQYNEGVGEGNVAEAKSQLYYGRWMEAVKGDDFVGVQNYERQLWGPKGMLSDPKDVRFRNAGGKEVYAASLAGAVRDVARTTGVPVFVTEQGVDADDDAIRAWLIPAALAELKKAMDDGVKVIGYCHWSLLDNFEWMLGYKHHYGLVAVDRTTFKRTPKPSAAVYRRIALANAV